MSGSPDLVQIFSVEEAERLSAALAPNTLYQSFFSRRKGLSEFQCKDRVVQEISKKLTVYDPDFSLEALGGSIDIFFREFSESFSHLGHNDKYQLLVELLSKKGAISWGAGSDVETEMQKFWAKSIEQNAPEYFKQIFIARVANCLEEISRGSNDVSDLARILKIESLPGYSEENLRRIIPSRPGERGWLPAARQFLFSTLGLGALNVFVYIFGTEPRPGKKELLLQRINSEATSRADEQVRPYELLPGADVVLEDVGGDLGVPPQPAPPAPSVPAAAPEIFPVVVGLFPDALPAELPAVADVPLPLVAASPALVEDQAHAQEEAVPSFMIQSISLNDVLDEDHSEPPVSSEVAAPLFGAGVGVVGDLRVPPAEAAPPVAPPVPAAGLGIFPVVEDEAEGGPVVVDLLRDALPAELPAVADVPLPLVVDPPPAAPPVPAEQPEINPAINDVASLAAPGHPFSPEALNLITRTPPDFSEILAERFPNLAERQALILDLLALNTPEFPANELRKIYLFIEKFNENKFKLEALNVLFQNPRAVAGLSNQDLIQLLSPAYLQTLEHNAHLVQIGKALLGGIDPAAPAVGGAGAEAPEAGINFARLSELTGCPEPILRLLKPQLEAIKTGNSDLVVRGRGILAVPGVCIEEGVAYPAEEAAQREFVLKSVMGPDATHLGNIGNDQLRTLLALPGLSDVALNLVRPMVETCVREGRGILSDSSIVKAKNLIDEGFPLEAEAYIHLTQVPGINIDSLKSYCFIAVSTVLHLNDEANRRKIFSLLPNYFGQEDHKFQNARLLWEALKQGGPQQGLAAQLQFADPSPMAANYLIASAFSNPPGSSESAAEKFAILMEIPEGNRVDFIALIRPVVDWVRVGQGSDLEKAQRFAAHGLIAAIAAEGTPANRLQAGRDYQARLNPEAVRIARTLEEQRRAVLESLPIFHSVPPGMFSTILYQEIFGRPSSPETVLHVAQAYQEIASARAELEKEKSKSLAVFLKALSDSRLDPNDWVRYQKTFEVITPQEGQFNDLTPKQCVGAVLASRGINPLLEVAPAILGLPPRGDAESVAAYTAKLLKEIQSTPSFYDTNLPGLVTYLRAKNVADIEPYLTAFNKCKGKGFLDFAFVQEVQIQVQGQGDNLPSVDVLEQRMGLDLVLNGFSGLTERSQLIYALRDQSDPKMIVNKILEIMFPVLTPPIPEPYKTALAEMAGDLNSAGKINQFVEEFVTLCISLQGSTASMAILWGLGKKIKEFTPAAGATAPVVAMIKVLLDKGLGSTGTCLSDFHRTHPDVLSALFKEKGKADADIPECIAKCLFLNGEKSFETISELIDFVLSTDNAPGGDFNFAHWGDASPAGGGPVPVFQEREGSTLYHLEDIYRFSKKALGTETDLNRLQFPEKDKEKFKGKETSLLTHAQDLYKIFVANFDEVANSAPTERDRSKRIEEFIKAFAAKTAEYLELRADPAKSSFETLLVRRLQESVLKDQDTPAKIAEALFTQGKYWDLLPELRYQAEACKLTGSTLDSTHVKTLMDYFVKAQAKDSANLTKAEKFAGERMMEYFTHQWTESGKCWIDIAGEYQSLKSAFEKAVSNYELLKDVEEERRRDLIDLGMARSEAYKAADFAESSSSSTSLSGVVFLKTTVLATDQLITQDMDCDYPLLKDLQMIAANLAKDIVDQHYPKGPQQDPKREALTLFFMLLLSSKDLSLELFKGLDEDGFKEIKTFLKENLVAWKEEYLGGQVGLEEQIKALLIKLKDTALYDQWAEFGEKLAKAAKSSGVYLATHETTELEFKPEGFAGLRGGIAERLRKLNIEVASLMDSSSSASSSTSGVPTRPSPSPKPRVSAYVMTQPGNHHWKMTVAADANQLYLEGVSLGDKAAKLALAHICPQPGRELTELKVGYVGLYDETFRALNKQGVVMSPELMDEIMKEFCQKPKSKPERFEALKRFCIKTYKEMLADKKGPDAVIWLEHFVGKNLEASRLIKEVLKIPTTTSSKQGSTTTPLLAAARSRAQSVDSASVASLAGTPIIASGRSAGAP